MIVNLSHFISNQWLEELPLFTEEKKPRLYQQTISQDSPGKILRDFAMLLDFLQPNGVEVSSNYHFFSLKYLEELNSRLSYPIQTYLKRPQQKSYPYIHGLYFLVRTSGLSQVVKMGKKSKLILDLATLESWQLLNPTERYFSLLESWLIWGNSELLDGYRDPFGILYRCLQFWKNLPDSGTIISSYKQQEEWVYYPGYYNLALLHLFGLIDLQSGEPEPAKGWRMVSLQGLTWGNSIMGLLSDICKKSLSDREENLEDLKPNFRIAFEKLQPYFSPFFPEWQKSLVICDGQFLAGVHIFKVFLWEAWRKIALPGSLSLDEVAEIIVELFDFNWGGHLYRFLYTDPLGRTTEISHPLTGIPPYTDNFKLGDLSLSSRSQLTLIYDLIEEWEFEMVWENVAPLNEENQEPVLLDYYGKPPEQYGDEYEENY
jgi:hypothetical protein